MKSMQAEYDATGFKSLPVRGAWIEMRIGRNTLTRIDVAPRKGSVD